MKKNTVHFSRLLKIFRINGKPAFVIELKESQNNYKPTLYLSYFNQKDDHRFKKREEVFDDIFFLTLSEHCLMDQCENGDNMFLDSHITHFENVNCSKLKSAKNMFSYSRLCSVNGSFPSLTDGSNMFSFTEITSVLIDFPNLIVAENMFKFSRLKSFTGNLDNLENGKAMFFNCNLSVFNSKMPNIKDDYFMFEKNPTPFKINYPNLFI